MLVSLYVFSVVVVKFWFVFSWFVSVFCWVSVLVVFWNVVWIDFL